MTKTANEETVIEITDYEVIDEKTFTFTGEVISVHDGFCFIGSVRRQYQTINTNGDVFCPTDEINVEDIVGFNELNTDHERQGKFRTEKITKITQEKLELTSINAGTFSLTMLAKELNPYHITKKDIDHKEIEQAFKNAPFTEMLQRVIKTLQDEHTGGRSIIKMAETFLTNQFPALVQLNVSYSVKGDVDKETEKNTIKETIQEYKDAGLDGQVESINKEFKRFIEVRQILTAMREHDILKIDSIIPIEHLPEILVACPVWFIDGKKDLPNEQDDDDPLPNHAIKFFSDSVGSKEFAWLFQIYNQRNRPLRSFNGRDIMPPKLVKIMKQAIKVFDYTVIATPYHDLASEEWADKNWLRNIDPYLLGFVKDVPYMFLMGRWSGAGLLPLVLDMIADTINHLRINKDKLNNFPSNTYWYKGNYDDGEYDSALLAPNNNESNNVLEPFADSLIQAFEEGWLFSFLRGEKKPE